MFPIANFSREPHAPSRFIGPRLLSLRVTRVLIACMVAFALSAIFGIGSSTDLAALPTKANPASAHCDSQGGQHMILREAGGGSRGICLFDSGSSVCEEWAYFQGQCNPGDCHTRCEAGLLNDCRGRFITRC